ncbi:KilA-N domain-containing protein [Pseudomonas putida]|uniref:DNA-binding protein n=1 Tax=Pseudomonas putida TaxID=303 RepID=A0A1L5PNS6_PSEPU|nr:KilA-N domain-containing protein [Pseudomonas putida]APO81656.1 DNA-binding protein [Pseudomonas putida]
MIESNVIPFHYQGQAVRFKGDGWINATDVAKRFGKRPAHWLELPSTKSYMNALRKHLGAGFDVGKSDLKLVESSKVRGKAGTWLHPKLAVAFARWLDDDFAVWADLHIDALLRGELNEKQQFDRACRALDDAKAVASLSGRELARWRNKKPGLEHQVEYWRDQLQMTLGLDAA